MLEDDYYDHSFQVDARTGHVVQGYVTFSDGKVANTVEHREGLLFADYDADGSLHGIEMLGPCKFADIKAIIGDDETRLAYARSVIPKGFLWL